MRFFFSTDECPAWCNFLTFAFAACGCYVTWNSFPVTHSELLWFAFFYWSGWMNFNAGMKKI